MITIISGTNRSQSISRKIAEQYQEILERYETQCKIIDLADLPIDFIATALYENAGKNPGFNLFRESIEASDKFIFIVPEYNGSFPGVLKAFLDGMRYPGAFTNKKCALVGLSSGNQGAGMALSHLTDIFNYLGMHVLAFKPKLARIEGNMTNGKLSHEKYVGYLKKQAQQLIEF